MRKPILLISALFIALCFSSCSESFQSEYIYFNSLEVQIPSETLILFEDDMIRTITKNMEIEYLVVELTKGNTTVYQALYNRDTRHYI